MPAEEGAPRLSGELCCPLVTLGLGLPAWNTGNRTVQRLPGERGAFKTGPGVPGARPSQ